MKIVQMRTFFWSVFSRIQPEYEELSSISNKIKNEGK